MIKVNLVLKNLFATTLSAFGTMVVAFLAEVPSALHVLKCSFGIRYSLCIGICTLEVLDLSTKKI